MPKDISRNRHAFKKGEGVTRGRRGAGGRGEKTAGGATGLVGLLQLAQVPHELGALVRTKLGAVKGLEVLANARRRVGERRRLVL